MAVRTSVRNNHAWNQKTLTYVTAISGLNIWWKCVLSINFHFPFGLCKHCFPAGLSYKKQNVHILSALYSGPKITREVKSSACGFALTTRVHSSPQREVWEKHFMWGQLPSLRTRGTSHVAKPCLTLASPAC